MIETKAHAAEVWEVDAVPRASTCHNLCYVLSDKTYDPLEAKLPATVHSAPSITNPNAHPRLIAYGTRSLSLAYLR